MSGGHTGRLAARPSVQGVIITRIGLDVKKRVVFRGVGVGGWGLGVGGREGGEAGDGGGEEGGVDVDVEEEPAAGEGPGAGAGGG